MTAIDLFLSSRSMAIKTMNLFRTEQLRPPIAATNQENEKRLGAKNKINILLVALCVGLIVRYIPVAAQDFPLMDGGLFYSMVQDLQASNFALPTFTSYNYSNIPFVYPPLAFYMAAMLQSIKALNLEHIFRWFPFAISLLTIPAFFAFASIIFPSKRVLFPATVAFSLMPEPIHWMLMGGGLTRSLGFLFAILALRSIYLMYLTGRRRDLISTIVMASLCVVTHLQMAWFTAYSAALLALIFGRNRRGLMNSFVAGLGVIALTSPWWLTVLIIHGWTPFNSSANHGFNVLGGLPWLFLTGGTGEPFIPMLAFMAILGILFCLLNHRFWLPAWLLAIFALDGWVPTTVASIPMALLGGIGIIDVLWPLLVGTQSNEKKLCPDRATWSKRSVSARLLLAAIGIYVAISSLGSGLILLSSLSMDERTAMRWISQNTLPSSRFLVLTAERWSVDRSSEWFPTISDRLSVGTVQGSEWLPEGEFSRRVELNSQLIACAQKGIACVDRLMDDSDANITHIYVPKRPASLYSASFWRFDQPNDCCGYFRESLSADSNYRLIYENPGANVYVRLNSSDE